MVYYAIVIILSSRRRCKMKNYKREQLVWQTHIAATPHFSQKFEVGGKNWCGETIPLPHHISNWCGSRHTSHPTSGAPASIGGWRF